MLVMATEFKLIFRMTARAAGDVVCFKQDGQRFDQTHTVKLNTDTEYDLKFTLKPAIYVDKLMINGELHKLELCTDIKDESEDVRTYRTQYETVGHDVTKKGKRKELLFVLELENGVYMKISLQCKLYKVGETDHSHWGQKLTTVDMDCKMEEGHNYVTIMREKYL
ncbi:uncharacterized protein LOC123564065 [Mercenaria mercenaria]|uniref:uncharacterized protein LOC123564065 n=1 Tax=Mercenaria mercenaria TaxID=6596 RepID=UPI00234E9A79|nr:uncharacterized protein LOC123564065 [Mercenaria mercenaria]